MSTLEGMGARIAGYIDDELDMASRDEVAELIALEDAWRTEHALQLAVRDRLGALERPALSDDARARFSAALARHASEDVALNDDQVEADVIPLPSRPPEAEAPPVADDAPRTRWSLIALAAAALLVSLAAFYILEDGAKGPPVIQREALAQYDLVKASPGSFEEVAVEDVSAHVSSWGWTYHDPKDDGNELELLRSWESTIRGERALVMAFERDGEVVVQLLVDQDAFDESDEIKDSIWRTGLWSSARAERTVVGWHDGAHAVMMVGTGTPESLSKYRPEACYGYKKKTPGEDT